tara:strand:- start:4517 stop:5617 length:1101 start_codon:yes stop_codon:yes gene_type:complete
MTKKIYLLILGEHLGGVEIRFLRIFKVLTESSLPINLIFCKGYLEKVVSFDEFKDFEYYNNKIKFIEPFEFYKKKSFNVIYSHVSKIIESDAVIHFNQNFPASYLGKISHKTIYTFNENSLSRFSFKDYIFFFLILLRANAIDILDPIIYSKYKNLFFFKKNFHKTKAGSLNLNDFELNLNNKQNSIVFSGRFNEQKQVLLYVNSIDYLSQYLIDQNIINIEFYVIGDGPLTNVVNKKIASLREKGITIHTGYMKDYKKIIETSKIFLSIQKYNNYPSNSLMEAMAAGNIPVVTNNGSTKLLAKEEFSFYVPEEFTPQDLSSSVSSIFKLNQTDYEEKAKLARKTINDEFNVNLAAKYYTDIYKYL